MSTQDRYGQLRALLGESEGLNGHHHQWASAQNPKHGGIDWPTVAMYTAGLALDTLIVLGVVKLLRKLFS